MSPKQQLENLKADFRKTHEGANAFFGGGGANRNPSGLCAKAAMHKKHPEALICRPKRAEGRELARRCGG